MDGVDKHAVEQSYGDICFVGVFDCFLFCQKGQLYSVSYKGQLYSVVCETIN